jgi:hypothetical protein
LVPNAGLAASQCETCAPGYTLVGGRCEPAPAPTPAPQTPGFAPVAPPPPPPAGFDKCSVGRVFDGRIGKCVVAPPPVKCGPMVGSKCSPPCEPMVVCRSRNNPCSSKTTICVPPTIPPRRTPAPAPTVTVPRVTRPLPGVPGGEIVEGGEAPPA